MRRALPLFALLSSLSLGLAAACGAFESDETTAPVDAGGVTPDTSTAVDAGDGGAVGDAPSDVATDAPPDVAPDVATDRGYRFIWDHRLVDRSLFASIASADAECMSRLPVGVAKAKAILVAGSSRRACQSGGCSTGAIEHIDWPLAPSTEYRRPDGAVVGKTDAFGLFGPTLTSPISTIDGGAIWTGLAPDLTWLTSQTCGDWASTASNVYGHVGSPGATTGGVAFTTFLSPCNEANGLYCVEVP